ncbi:MAG: helix-turn-helix domain-containing protein [Tsuneonella sp.]
MTSSTEPRTTRQPRRDGWTAARRRRFLGHLRDGLDVRRAAALVGMSRRSVYHLRRRDEDFSRAWDGARCAAREALSRRLRALLVERYPWSRAAFPEAAAEGSGLSAQDTVTPVTECELRLRAPAPHTAAPTSRVH